MTEARPPRVFMSYSHDSVSHTERVLRLARRLAADGCYCIVDQDDPHPAEGWPAWMDRQLDEADFVVVVCSWGYYQKVKAGKRPTSGLGVKFESLMLLNDLYDAGMWNERIVPVSFGALPTDQILRPLRGYTRYRIDREEGYEGLLRQLTGQPRHQRPTPGPLRNLPPAEPGRRTRSARGDRGRQRVDTSGDSNTSIQISGSYNEVVVGAAAPSGPTSERLEQAPTVAGSPSPTYRCLAPRPRVFTARREYASVLGHLLAAAGDRAGSSVGITALRGLGGVGKTTLAQAVCHDPQVQAAYPDGVLWVTLGQGLTDGDRLSRLRDLLRRWCSHEPPAFETVAAAGGYLCGVLAGQQVLLVADDVWSSLDIAAFRDLDPASTLFLTTRDRGILPEGCLVDELDTMASDEAVALLAEGIADLPLPRLSRLAHRLSEWPLLLALVHRQIRERVEVEKLPPMRALEEVETTLSEEGLEAFDRKDDAERSLDVGRTLMASLSRLAEGDRSRYEELAIFPEGADIPCRTLAGLWGVSQREAIALCRRLQQLSLAARFDSEAQTLRLHDVLRDWLRGRNQAGLPGRHRRFLDARRPAAGWGALPPAEPYLWRHLAYHLAEAGAGAELRSLLLDYAWLEAKLAATDVNALLADYDALVSDDPDLRLVENALRLSAHVLADHPGQLPGQLLGRLLGRTEPGIVALCEHAHLTPSGLWLRPRSGSLVQPGGALIRTLSILPDQITTLGVLPDGRVVSGSSAGLLRIWDLDTGKVTKTLQGHEGKILAAVILSDGRIVSASADRTLRLWDVAGGDTVRSLEVDSDQVTALAPLGVDGVVFAAAFGPPRVWDLVTGESTRLRGGLGIVVMAVLSGTRIVCGSTDGQLRVLNLETGEVERTITIPAKHVSAVVVLQDGRVVSGSEDGVVRVWDPATGEATSTLAGHSGAVDSLAVLPDGRLVSGSDDRTLRVWDIESGKIVRVLEGHSVWVRAIAALPDGRFVSCSDGTLRVWKLGSDTGATPAGSYWVTALAELPDGRIVSGSGDGALRIWDKATGAITNTLREIGPSETIRTIENDAILAMAVLPDGRVACGTFDETVRVWNVETGELVNTLRGHSGQVDNVAVLPDGHIVSSSVDGTLRVWDLATGESAALHWDRLSEAAKVSLLPDGRVMVAFEGGLLQASEMETGEVDLVLAGHTSWVNSLSVLPGGRLVSGSNDRTVRLWDLGTGKTIRVFEGHVESVLAVTALPDGFVVSGSVDHTLRIWDPATAETLLCFTLDAPVTALSTIGDRDIAAGDAAGRVHFFRVEGLGSPARALLEAE
jgi:WD40 repeat protein